MLPALTACRLLHHRSSPALVSQTPGNFQQPRAALPRCWEEKAVWILVSPLVDVVFSVTQESRFLPSEVFFLRLFPIGDALHCPPPPVPTSHRELRALQVLPASPIPSGWSSWLTGEHPSLHLLKYI